MTGCQFSDKTSRKIGTKEKVGGAKWREDDINKMAVNKYLRAHRKSRVHLEASH